MALFFWIFAHPHCEQYVQVHIRPADQLPPHVCALPSDNDKISHGKCRHVPFWILSFFFWSYFLAILWSFINLFETFFSSNWHSWSNHIKIEVVYTICSIFRIFWKNILWILKQFLWYQFCQCSENGWYFFLH